MKKIGTTALVALTAITLTAFSIGCEKKPDPAKKPADKPAAPAGGTPEKPADKPK